MIKRIFAFLVLAITTLTAAAADVYISDFSIKAGETKMIDVNFDSDRTDLKRFMGTITMPAGLTVLNQGTTTNYLWMTPDATRTNGGMGNYNYTTGQIAIYAIGTTFNAGTGAIAHIQVMATTDLADVSTITLSNFTGTTTSNETVNLTSQNCTVTREAGTGGGGGTDPSTETDDLAFSFSPSTLTMTGGEVKQVEVQMANGMTSTGMMGDLVASTGLTIQSVTKGSRLTGWLYNPDNGRVFSLGAISGNEGTVFTVTLKADDDFSGAATLKFTNISATNAAAKSFTAEDAILPVTVQSQKNVALSFGSTEVSLNPGESTTVDVTLSSEVDLTGFMGTLTLPTGITATIAQGAIVNSVPMYNTSTGVVFYIGGITAREGVLFTLTLTADDTFTADGNLTFTGISTTTASALSIVPADISMDVKLKNSATLTAPTAKENLAYTGQAQELVNAGSVTGGELQYSTDGTNYTTAIPTGLNAGTYTVYYKVVGDASHNDVAPASLNVTIAKAALTIATLTNASLTYTGSEQTVSVASVKAGELDVPAVEYTVTGDKATNVGDYTATVTANATSTNFTGSATAQWSITAAGAATFTVTVDPSSFVYDGTAKQPAVTVKDGETVLTENTDYTLAFENNVNAGTAKVTATGKGNYSGTKEATFTIEKAPLSAMTLDPTSFVYNKTAQTASVTSVKAGELDVPATDYSVSGNTETAAGTYTVTVTATGNNFQGTLTQQFTIAAASTANLDVTLGTATYSYDGTEKQPTVTVKDGETVLVAGTDYTVAYSDNVNAGTATVTVTGQGNYTGEKTATFTIAKAQLTAVTLSQTSLTYTGSEQTVSVSSVKAGELDVPAADYDVTGNVQTAAGTYTVTVTAKAESNYAGSATAQFTITKAAASVTAPTAKTGLVYNATAQQLVNEGSAEGATMLYSLDGTTYSEAVPTATNAGTYTVYYKATGDANHSDVAAASIEVTIAKAALTTVTLAETSLTYNGSEQTVTVSSVKAGTLDVAAADYDVTGNVQTNVGNYTATVTAKAESNFTGSTTAQWSITAAGTASFTLTLNPTSFVYDGTEKKPAVTVKDGETVLVENTDYTLAYENNVNAGTAKVIATGMGNYSGTKEATFTITKADATVTAPTAKTGLVFNATAQALIEAGSAEGGQMLYSTDGTNYSESVPAKTDAGTYTVYYKVTGDQNHNDVAAASVNVTIAKAALTSVTLSQTSLVYNKTEQTVSAVSVKAGDLTVAAADYDVTGNKQTAAGTYTATVTAKAESNFTGEATAQWTIAAADAATSFTLTLNPETFIYDGTAKQPAVTVKDGSAVLTEGTDYTVAYADNTNVGTATVTVTGKGNYSGTKTAQFTITSGVAVVTTAPEGVADLYYNGEAQTLVSAGAAAGGTMQYSLDGTTWQTTLPTAVNAGAYTVYYKTVGDASHSDSEPAVVSVAIYKAPLTEMTLAQTTLTYNGTEQSVAVSSVKAENLDVTATDYTVSGNKATDVGTYNVTVTAKEDGNFTGSATAQWSIVAAGAEAKFTVELEYTTVEYDGTAKEPAVTVKDGAVVLTKDVDYTVAYLNNVNAGTAQVTATGINNYSGTKTATFTISPKTVGLTWGVTTFDADGTAKQPTVEVTGLVAGDACEATVSGTGMAVGSYTATVTSLSNANYVLPETASTEFAVVRDMSNVFSDGYAWATYVAQEDLNIPEGVEAYTVSNVTATEVTAEPVSYIPVGVGILLKRTDVAVSTYKGTAFTGTTTAVESKLVGNATAETMMTAYKDFVLYRDEFVLSSVSACVAGKAYLPAATAPAAVRRMAIVISGETAGIGAISADNATEGFWYDMNGRRLQGKPAVKGVYVHQGKKVVVK